MKRWAYLCCVCLVVNCFWSCWILNHVHVERLWCVNMSLYMLFHVGLWFVGLQNMDDIVAQYQWARRLGAGDVLQRERRDTICSICVHLPLYAWFIFIYVHISTVYIYIYIHTVCPHVLCMLCFMLNSDFFRRIEILLSCHVCRWKCFSAHLFTLSGHLLAAWILQSLLSVTLTDWFCHSSRLRCRCWSCVFAG